MLLTQIAVGSLYMFSISKGNMEGFISWCRQVIAICVTAFLQMTLLYLGLLTWKGNMLFGLGVMLVANEVPNIAGSIRALKCTFPAQYKTPRGQLTR